MKDVSKPKVRQALNRYRAIFEQANDAILLLAGERVVECNPQAQRLFGRTREQLLGATPWELSPPQQPNGQSSELLARQWLAAVVAGEREQFEWSHWRADGQLIDTEVSLSRLDSTDQPLVLAIVHDITARRKREQMLQRRTAQLLLLSEVSHRLAAQLELEPLLDEAARLIQESFGYHHVGIFTLEPGQQLLIMRARAGYFSVLFPAYHALQLGQGVVGWVASHGEPLVANEVEKEPRYVNLYPDRLPTRAELAVPIRLANSLLGVLDVQSPTPMAFDETDLLVLSALADQLAVALDNARLYEETRRRLAREEQLNALAHALSSELELAPLFQRFLPIVTALVGADCASVSMVAADGWIEHDCYQYNLPLALEPARRPPDEGLASETLRERRPLIISDYQQHPRALPEWVAAGVRATLSLPLLVGSTVVGALGLFKMGKAEPFAQEALLIAEAAAQLASVAIQRAQLFARERSQRQLAEALSAATAAIASSLELDVVLDQVLEQALLLTGAEAGDVMLVEGPVARPVRWRRYEQWEAEGVMAQLSWPLATTPNLKWMIRTQAPLVIPDVAASPDWIPVAGLEWQHAYLGVPIVLGGLVIGFLNVVSAYPQRFSVEDGQRLQALANQVGTVIENAALFRRLRQYAEQLEAQVDERTAQLRSQVARAEAILQSITEGLVITARDGTFLQHNALVQRWLEQLPALEVEQLHTVIGQLTEQAATYPRAGLELSGLDLELRAAPITHVTEDPAYAVISIHDVTELKAVERMKTAFVSNVSHELRTPITTILLYAELLEGCRPDQVAEYLSAIREEARRQAQILEDVLQLSRLDAQRVMLNRQVVELNALAQTTTGNHQLLAKTQKVELTLECEEPSPFVVVDPAQALHIFNNLVENALRYTPPGGRVTICTGQATHGERAWGIFTVTDTGFGISPEELPHIFERFYRGAEPQKRQISGTGLGLAIVKELVELHGGRITVASQPGQGSTFTVWLPLADGEALAAIS